MSKTKKQRVSAQEILLAQRAQEKDARFESAFRPLEKKAIERLDKANLPSREALLTGRAGADVQQRVNTLPAFDPNNVAAGFETARATGAGATTAKADARATAASSLDADRMNVIRTGANVSRSADTLLTDAARLENARAASKIDAKRTVDTAKGEALGDLVIAGVGGHLAAKDKAFRMVDVPNGTATPSKAFMYPDDSLGFYSRTLRKRG